MLSDAVSLIEFYMNIIRPSGFRSHAKFLGGLVACEGSRSIDL